MSPLTGMVGYGGGGTGLTLNALAKAAYQGDRGCWAGGESGSYLNNIDYISIPSTGNATDFGDLEHAKRKTTGCSGGGRGLTFGGRDSGGYIWDIDYITFSTTGNAQAFGNLAAVMKEGGSCSDGTTGLYFGGENTGNIFDHILYVTIATTSNTSSWGTITSGNRDGAPGCVSDGNRGLAGGGTANGSSITNVIDYLSFASAGNTSDFGDLTVSRTFGGACSNDTRGVWGGGWTGSKSNVLDYVTIQTTGNATDYGDLTQAAGGGIQDGAMCANLTRGLWGGGQDGDNNYSNQMLYITLANTGNSTDFGDLLVNHSMTPASYSGD